MNRTALRHQLLAEPVPQSLAQPAATVGREEDPSGERYAATLQVPEQGLADLMILRGALPAPQGHLLPGHVHAQGHEKRLGHPGDRVQKERKRCTRLQRPLLERLELRGGQLHSSLTANFALQWCYHRVQ